MHVVRLPKICYLLIIAKFMEQDLPIKCNAYEIFIDLYGALKINVIITLYNQKKKCHHITYLFFFFIKFYWYLGKKKLNCTFIIKNHK